MTTSLLHDSGSSSFLDIRSVQRDLTTLTKANKRVERDLQIIGTRRDTTKFRQQLKSRLHDATTQSTHLRKNIQDLANSQEYSNDMQLQKLQKQFKTEVSRLKSVFEQVSVKERQYRPQQSGVDTFGMGNGDSSSGAAASGNNGYSQLDGQQAQSQEEIFVVMNRNAELERREEAVYQIAEDLQELNEMHLDLNELVGEQGEQIETLKTNVVEARDHVESGTGHLVKAGEHQKAYRKKMCYLLVVILVIAVVVVIIVFGTKSN